MFKVGDRVWDIRLGWGEVIKCKNEEYYPCPVVVRFLSEKEEHSYTKDGKIWTSHLNPTLFFDEFTIPEGALIRPKWRVSSSGGIYHYVDSDGMVEIATEYFYDIDNRRFELGNYFKTEEEAIESKFYKIFHEVIE